MQNKNGDFPFSSLRSQGSLWLLVGFACVCVLILPTKADGQTRQVRRHLTRPTIEFSHPPTDIANVIGVRPLGNLNPGGGHVLAVDHMYIGYPVSPYNGAFSYPVCAMADGAIVMVIRTDMDGKTDKDWEVYIAHNAMLTSYFIHMHTLSRRLESYLATTPDAAWINVGGEMRLLFLGQRGAPAPLPVTSGEQLGMTKNFSQYWDVGVIDTRVYTAFVGKGPRRYPNIADYLQLLGVNANPPYPGHKTINSACFINYLKNDLREAWFNLLISTPRSCGQPGWDVPGKLRGAWFNPALDTASPPPLFDVESGAISIIPDNLAPMATVQIGIASGNPFAALDPVGSYPQLRNPFKIAMNTGTGSRINPDPATVSPSTGTVCYDMAYGSDSGWRYNTILFHMVTDTSVAIKFDPTAYGGPQCAAIPLGEPDATWTTTYVR